MNAKDLIEKVKDLEIKEVRSVSDEYAEAVFFTKDTDDWIRVLSEELDEPAKPAGEEPSEGDSNLTEDHGGIFTNQTLFKKKFDDGLLLAMFWPWQDNTHTTLKIAFTRQ